MIDHLIHLFEYDNWANVQIINALSDKDSNRSRQILAHILITKREYFERLYGKDSSGFDFWPDLSIEECRQLAGSTYDRYRRLLRSADERTLRAAASYRTSEGVPHTNTYLDMLTHILFHSSIHRGNIILKMREEGLEPPKIDYILYLRDQRT